MCFPEWVDNLLTRTLPLKVFTLKFLQRDFYNIVLINSFFIFSNSKTIMNFTLSNIIGSTLDPRQQVILQKNLSVILRYDEVCSLASKLIYSCD